MRPPRPEALRQRAPNAVICFDPFHVIRVRHEAPNSVNLLSYDTASLPLLCRLERWDYRSAGGQFEMYQTRDLTLGR